jgi:peptidoglycan/LPS O-acetylase OafA/YrhL
VIVCAIAAAAIAQKTLPVMELRTVASAAVCFFLGGLVFEVWRAMRARPLEQIAGLAAIAGAASAVSLAYYATQNTNDVIPRLITFPAAILALALAQSLAPSAGYATRLIGDVTYSTYLIHFPIQLAILLAAKQGQWTINFYEPWVFVSFISAVVVLSIPVYYAFELPMQKWIRARMSGRKNNQLPQVHA